MRRGTVVDRARAVPARPPQTAPQRHAVSTAGPDHAEADIDERAARLTRQLARGDRDALARFYSLWFDRCYALARALTGRDESFCLDVVQDAMLRIVRTIRPMPTEADLRRWLARVVHHAALDRLRQERRRRARDLHASRSADSRAGAESADLDTRIDAVRCALAQLSDDDRALLTLRFGGGHTLRSAAHTLGLTTAAAHGRIRRALARLRRRMEDLFP